MNTLRLCSTTFTPSDDLHCTNKGTYTTIWIYLDYYLRHWISHYNESMKKRVRYLYVVCKSKCYSLMWLLLNTCAYVCANMLYICYTFYFLFWSLYVIILYFSFSFFCVEDSLKIRWNIRFMLTIDLVLYNFNINYKHLNMRLIFCVGSYLLLLSFLRFFPHKKKTRGMDNP